MLNKGVSPLISTVFIILISISAISIVLLIALPAIEKGKEAAIINEAMQNMKSLSNSIKDVASEGVGSLRTLSMKVTAGEYKINEKSNSIDFTYAIKSDIIQPDSMVKEGDITL